MQTHTRKATKACHLQTSCLSPTLIKTFIFHEHSLNPYIRYINQPTIHPFFKLLMSCGGQGDVDADHMSNPAYLYNWTDPCSADSVLVHYRNVRPTCIDIFRFVLALFYTSLTIQKCILYCKKKKKKKE